MRPRLLLVPGTFPDAAFFLAGDTFHPAVAVLGELAVIDRRVAGGDHLEIEVAAVAWLVCQRNGVSARSKDYLSSLVRQVDLTEVSMYAIFEAANRVEARTQPPERK